MAQINSIITNNLVVGTDILPRILNGQASINGPIFAGSNANIPSAIINVAPPTLNFGATTPLWASVGMNISMLGPSPVGLIINAVNAITANGIILFNGAKIQNGPAANNGIGINNGVDVDNSAAVSNGIKVNSSKQVTGSKIITPTVIAPKVIGYCVGNKPFDIPHWKKKGKRVRHVCAEGPEAGIYIRGKLDGKNTIDLPEYWDGLVDPETITVNLTAYKRPQNLYVKDIQYGRRVIIGNEDGSMPTCFYEVWVARWIDPTNHDEELHVVYDGETPDDYPGNNENFLIGGWDYDRRNPQRKDSTETGSGA